MNALISASPSSRRAGPGRDDVRPGLAGVGDEALAAVDDPRPPSASSNRAVVRVPPASLPAPGSVSPYAPRTWPRRHRDEEALLLLAACRRGGAAAAEARVRGDDEPERAPHAADLLDRDRVGERVEARAALVLGDRDAEPAHLAEAPTISSGKRRSRSCSSTTGATSFCHEVADGVAQQDVLGERSKSIGPRLSPAA